MKNRNSEKGSIILPTLLIVLIIASAGGTYLSMSFTEFKMSHRNQDLQSAINLAEAGIEEAMIAMKNDDWSLWTTVATDHYYFTPNYYFGVGNGRTGTWRCFVSMIDEGAPIVFAEGRVTSSDGMTKKQIRLDLGRKGLFVNGLTAKDTIDFNGNNVSIDSYDSDLGTYASQRRRDNGSVASNAIVDGAVTPGNGDIFGYVATGGGEPSFGPKGTLRGWDTPSGVSIDKERIAYDFYSEFENIDHPVGDPAIDPIIPQDGTIGNPSHTTPVNYYAASFANTTSHTLKIDGPVRLIIDGDWSSKGSIEVTANGSVELYVRGNMDVGGNGMVNLTNKPAKFVVFGTNTTNLGQTIKIHGNGAIHASIYAPNAAVQMKGGGSGGEFMGAVVASTILMTGNANFHYDETLATYATDSSYRIERWRELIDSEEKVPIDLPNEMIAYAVHYSTKTDFSQPSTGGGGDTSGGDATGGGTTEGDT